MTYCQSKKKCDEILIQKKLRIKILPNFHRCDWSLYTIRTYETVVKTVSSSWMQKLSESLCEGNCSTLITLGGQARYQNTVTRNVVAREENIE